MSKPKSDYSIQTVSNALRLLEAFQKENELGVSQLSRELSLHKNNVFRLLATLEERGYIEQCTDSERYRLGTRCMELGHAYANGQHLLRLARPALEALSRRVGECSHLGILESFEVVHLDGEAPPASVLSAVRVGARMPAHCTALGKVLLGCSAADCRESFDRQIAESRGLFSLTPATISDRDKFFEHLRGVSVQGYALDLEEYESGLSCVAAPVFGSRGELRAAVSVSGPSARLPEDRLLRELVPVVCEAADQLSRRLGASAQA